MGLSDSQTKLEYLIGLVADHQIPMGIGAGSAAAKGLSAVGIGKDIVGMSIPLHHRQRRVESHPENQIGKLTEASA